MLVHFILHILQAGGFCFTAGFVLVKCWNAYCTYAVSLFCPGHYLGNEAV